MLAQAVEDGIASNLNAADLFFLIATIVFAIAFVIRLMAKPIPIDGVVIAAGLTATALGLLLL
jgi:enoyl reductase-like protein